MSSEKSKPSIKWCKACIRIFPQGAKVCPHCGAPISRFSRLFFVHRNLVTAIIMSITAIGVTLTLVFSTLQIQLQRELWVEEHRPKMKMRVIEARRSNDTIFILNEINNYGLAPSTEPTLNINVYDKLGTRVSDTSSQYWPSIDPDVPIRWMERLLPSVTLELQDTFFVAMQLEFGWFKSSDEFEYNRSFQLVFDSVNSIYKPEVIAANKIPNRK